MKKVQILIQAQPIMEKSKPQRTKMAAIIGHL